MVHWEAYSTADRARPLESDAYGLFSPALPLGYGIESLLVSTTAMMVSTAQAPEEEEVLNG